MGSEPNLLTALDSCFCWNQGLWALTRELRVEGLSGEETCSTQMLGVPELLVTLLESEYYGGCGSTSLGFSCAGTCQISDQSRAIGKSRRNTTPI